jgi:TetR/AcrR family transcriptional repressor of nem operon
MGEIGDTSDLYQKFLQSAVNRYRDSLKSGLVQALQGIIRTDKSATEMADLLVNAWQGALFKNENGEIVRTTKTVLSGLIRRLF